MVCTVLHPSDLGAINSTLFLQMVQNPPHISRNIRVHRGDAFFAALLGAERHQPQLVVPGGPVQGLDPHEGPPGIASAGVFVLQPPAAQLRSRHPGELPEGERALMQLDHGEADVEQEAAGHGVLHVVDSPARHLGGGAHVVLGQLRTAGQANGLYPSWVGK